MKDGFYVDDLATGGTTVRKTHELFSKAGSRLAEGGFKLRKWLTYSAEFSDIISQNGSTKVSEMSNDETYAKATLSGNEKGVRTFLEF